MRLPEFCIGLFVSTLPIILTAAPARAQDYPSRPVHMLVGFTPGSAADITARVLGPRISETLGQQFVVENKPGAGSNLAAEVAAHAANDGYTLYVASSANITSAAVNPKLPFDMTRDFAPITLATGVPVVLVVNPGLGVSTVQELIALAKAKPGALLYGSPGVGTTAQLAAELFAIRTGVKLVHVPYQGSPQAVTDLLAGRVAMIFSPASTVLPHIAAGKLRVLATAGDRRPASLPDIPTLEEAGLPDFDATIWFGLTAPAGTSPAIVARLAGATDAALKIGEVQKILRAQGFEPLGGGPEEFAHRIASETARWREVARTAGLVP
jgi:tripartite-type tricarboxylate transporter receptor subunit TctC